MSNCYAVKVCVLGNSGVGKSCVAVRFVQDTFDSKICSTIGAAFLTKFMSSSNECSYKLQIWDTAGQERYKSLAPMYYRGASVVLLVYDITKRESLTEGIRDWVRELREKGPADPILALVGNKIDIDEDLREVDTEEAQEYANKIGAIFYEASAKTGHNISSLFTNICLRLDMRDKGGLTPIHGMGPAQQISHKSQNDKKKPSRWKFRSGKANVMNSHQPLSRRQTLKVEEYNSQESDPLRCNI